MLIKFNYKFFRYAYYNNNLKLHRLDGPAWTGVYGRKHWYRGEELHREDGPAIEWADGDRWFYLNNKRRTEEEYCEIILLKRFGGFV